MIVDAHQHFWDPSAADYPWLTDELAALRRRFGPDDLRPLLARTGVDRTVLVQTRSSIAETRDFLSTAEAVGFVAGVVGWVDLTAGGVDEAIATRAELDSEGRYTGRTELYCYGPDKVVAIEQAAKRDNVDLAASYAYSDSASDLPMLEAVGHPVVVNPDRELLRAAKERGWEVVRFSNRVPLRERVPMPAPRHAAMGGGAVLLLVAGLAAGRWWWLRHQRNQQKPPTVLAVAGKVPDAARTATGLVKRNAPSWQPRWPSQRAR